MFLLRRKFWRTLATMVWICLHIGLLLALSSPGHLMLRFGDLMLCCGKWYLLWAVWFSRLVSGIPKTRSDSSSFPSDPWSI